MWPYSVIFSVRDAYMPAMYKLFLWLLANIWLWFILGFSERWSKFFNISITNDFNEALKCCSIVGTFFFFNIISLIVYMNVNVKLIMEPERLIHKMSKCH